METSSMQSVYDDARSKAKREYNARKAKGESGHLTSLDGLIKDIEIMSTMDIGVHEISLKKIKGTYSNFRRMTFSKGFLPLEEAKSEFAGKWMALCSAHLEEGIRDPIKVYEYMNYFYVLEGNKRVSVLKYYDAASIHGQILRLIPKYNPHDPDVRRYYKFLDFYKMSGLNQIWMSHENSYNELAEILVEYRPTLRFYEDKFKHFYHFVYLPFRKMYKEHGGDQIQITTGDAFLLFAKIYDIPQEFDVEKALTIMPNLIKELKNKDLEASRSIQTDSEEFQESGFMKAFGMFGTKKVKIAFIYAKAVETSGWARSHELGRLAVEEYFQNNVETKSFENIKDDETLETLIGTLIEEGYNTIFTTSPLHRKVTLSAALIHTEVKFFNCSGNRPYVHMSSYYGRSYEPRFLTGIVAGALTKNNIIGYTANEPTPDNISSINAFAMGAKMVNPNVVIKVVYTGLWNSPKENEKYISKLMDLGADLISSKNDLLNREMTKDYGITSMLCTVDTERKALKAYVAAPIWHWEVFYIKIINSLINGSYSRIVRSSTDKKLLNFWWGLESGGLDVYLNENEIPHETLKLVKLMRNMIKDEQFKIFYGPVYDQNHQLVLADDEIMSAEDIIEMNWYVDHVELQEF
ncbi:MAG: BMP family ABC transporter substrate-binding protein [Clostridia bacterium]|nr:BMP family ABC transporter substrate-binding protein [Clostridia bacterium]